MCITPQGLMEAFGRELLSAYADEDGVPHEFDENEKTDLAIAKVGFKLASMCHQRLQNNGLKAGDTKEPLSVYYTWKDIQPNQVGVIQSLLIELDGVAKTRPTSMMRLGVRYWQGRYNDIFTATPNTQADHVDLLEELDFG
jgi:hypothetical protein